MTVTLVIGMLVGAVLYFVASVLERRERAQREREWDELWEHYRRTGEWGELPGRRR